MTTGLPGTGIGGLFYLASALAMPLRELRRSARRWGVVGIQVAMASGALAAIWATGWLLEVTLTAARPVIPVSLGLPPAGVWPTATIVVAAAVLAAVLLGVELLRLVVQRGPKRMRTLSILVALAVAHADSGTAQATSGLTVLAGGIRDSDGNRTVRLGGAFEFPASPSLRLGVAGARDQVESGAASAVADQLGLRAVWRPVKGVDVHAGAGATRLDVSGGSGGVLPTGDLRVRWRPAVELRARRNVVAASPLLLANHVVRTEVRAMVQAPVAGPLRLRGITGTAQLASTSDVNHRNTAGGALVWAVAPAGEIAAQIHEVRFSHPSAVGYFAPRVVQLAEAGTYLEHETAGSALFVLDLGVGARRLAMWGAPFGPWGRALRLYALIALPVTPGRELRLELEGEDSAVATEVATTAPWRYGSAVLSLRWALD